jgi:tetratricopeptide (TPR) repeat protein
MKKIYAILFFILASITVRGQGRGADTSEVNTLNTNGYNSRFTNPNEVIADADKALKLAIKLKYNNGIAESYRIKGIGEYYLNHPDSALNLYFQALEYYKNLNNELGMANVYNNVGNLYQMIDYEKALTYFEKAQKIALKYNDKKLKASLYLNMGNIFYRQNKYNIAKEYYKNSYNLFTELKNPAILVQCLENLGVIYYNLHQIDTARNYLVEAHTRAKTMDMNSEIATIDMNLTDIYIAEKNFNEAEYYIKEGRTYAALVHNDKDIDDYNHTAYELELKRKNYEKALKFLINIYQTDSANYKSTVSTKLTLRQNEEDHKIQDAVDKKSAEFSRKIFWALTGMACLLLAVVGLLINNVRRKATTNAQLQELNNEISRQKDNLDRINHHLEEIIDDRTKDLQIKNKKLSEYSSYLSHQIRGPIATLKGLMNLEREGLVDKQECIKMMDKCVTEIDEKIIEMSDMLHDPGKTGF